MILVPARLAHPAEIPTAARALLNACVDPWRARTLYAVGPVPYSWSTPGTLDDNGQRVPGTRTDGGQRLTACVLVQVAHPDGRRAAAIWTSDKVVKGAQTYGFAFGYRWREDPTTHRPDDIPRPIGALTLRAAVADPTWRPVPYVLEEAA